MDLVTLDSGALIALERNKARTRFLRLAVAEGMARILVPVPVIAEWWRGRTDTRERILKLVDVEPLTMQIARAAGEALARLPDRPRGPSAMDAIVVAHAANRGGVVYSSDVDDLGLLRDACFPGVRVLGI
jgi:predicted nucleic acid-binding protein